MYSSPFRCRLEDRSSGISADVDPAMLGVGRDVVVVVDGVVVLLSRVGVVVFSGPDVAVGIVLFSGAGLTVPYP